MSKKPYPYKIGRLSASSKGKLPQARKQTLRGGPGQADQAFLRNTDWFFSPRTKLARRPDYVIHDS